MLADGTRRCVRLQEFLEHSPTTVAILEGDRWEQVRRHPVAPTIVLVHSKNIEALIKPVGVVQRRLRRHLPPGCHLGRHPYGCSGTTIGIW